MASKPRLLIVKREQSGPLDTPWGVQLQRIEEKIGAGWREHEAYMVCRSYPAGQP